MYRTPTSLTVRLLFMLGLFFAIVWTAMFVIFEASGEDTLAGPIVAAVLFAFLQYMASPYIVQWSMGVRYVSEEEEPRLCGMVRELAARANIPMPRVGISGLSIPNAFAFGRWQSDGRVCVTQPLLDMLDDDEMRAVLGHEIMHLRNHDVAIITLLSLMPNIFYYLFRIGLRIRGKKSPGPLIALVSIIAYFVTQLLVLYASRIREYAADEGSVALGNEPHALSSAFLKLVQGSARLDRGDLRAASGFKAFFASDPSRAHREIAALAELDRDGSGTIDAGELAQIRDANVKRGFFDGVLELLSTHPDMLKRVQRLATLQQPGAGASGASYGRQTYG